MNTQHTPGPWAYMADSLEIIRADDVQPLIATVNIDNTSEDQALADARLIAAAPALLAALQSIAEIGPSLDFVGVREFALAAIAQATMNDQS